VSPISGVLTSSLSRMTDDTGRTIPNPRPPVNMAARIAGKGFNCFCVFIIIFYLEGFLSIFFTQDKKEDILISGQIKRAAQRDTKFKLDGNPGDF
jgi:hypothetical protein